MDPIRLIKEDHRTVKDLFRRFENADRRGEKQKLGQEIIEELSVHAVIEEQLIYPLLRASGEEEDVLNALEEHHAVKVILAELDKMSADHERYEAKMHVVQESVEMHIEEEESSLLPRLEAAIDADDREMLAERMLEMKQTAPNYPHPNATDTPPEGVMAGLVSAISDSGKSVVRMLTDADKAAGHRNVTRRANAARNERSGGGNSRAKRGTRRSSRRKTGKSTRSRSNARKSRTR
jgi:hemerythrin superfamily protein